MFFNIDKSAQEGQGRNQHLAVAHTVVGISKTTY